MTSWADPEILVGEWLRDAVPCKVWLDPNPPAAHWNLAAWAWVQRAQGGDTLALTLDDVLLDIDVYAAEADHARNLANDIWAAMTLRLPRHTFPNGYFVTSCRAFTPPCWAPDPKYRRTAAYSVILHGVLP